MNTNTIIDTENEIFYIYIAISILGLISNDLEKKNKEKYRSLNKFISISNTIALIIIYIYFLQLSYKKYKRKKSTKTLLLFISSILFLTAGLINLYVEIKYRTEDDEDGLEI